MAAMDEIERREGEEGEEESPLEAMRIQLESFSGPLDLLLHLIRKNKIDILDIPVAEVTRQYLDYLRIMREIDMEVASEFLVMAATLIHIKSRMLLPPDGEGEGEEEEKADPREELIRRLLEYKKYKRAAETLDARPALGRDVFLHPTEEVEEPEAVYREANLFQLMDAFNRVLESAEKRRPHEISREEYHLSDALALLEERFTTERDLRFEELFRPGDTLRKVVTIFLALLELIKREKLRALQPEVDGPLRLFAVGEWPQDGSTRALSAPQSLIPPTEEMEETDGEDPEIAG